MNRSHRTAGCPSVERNRRTKPTGGASPVSIPVGIDSPFAQLRRPGRADALKRRRKVRDEILGRRRKRLQSPLRKERRPTLSRCLVHPAVGDAADRSQSPQPLVVRQATPKDAGFFRKIQSASAVRTLDFRDHITALPPAAAPTARERRRLGWPGRNCRLWWQCRRGSVAENLLVSCARHVAWSERRRPCHW
jgi:hypothetical protein